MRICHIITRLIVGGAQENTLLTCEGLVARGHQVALIAGPETGPEGSLWDTARRSATDVTQLRSLRRNPNPYHDLRCARQLIHLLKAGRFDVVHTHSSKAGILGRWAAAKAGTPVTVHTIHGLSFNRTQSPPVRRLYRALERRMAKTTQAFVSVADAMTHQAVAAGIAPAERFVTIYSGMRVEQFTPSPERRRLMRARWGIGDEEVVVGTVARLFRNKGYDELMAVLPLAVARVGALRFVWVGEGPDRERYLRRLDAMGLRERVILTGLVAPEVIPELVSGFDLLAHASRWEGLPRAVVQGLLLEVPGICFDSDGGPEVVIDGVTGLLVPRGDALRFAEAVVELARSPERRAQLGQAGRRHCLARFSADKMVDAIERLYERLLAGCARP